MHFHIIAHEKRAGLDQTRLDKVHFFGGYNISIIMEWTARTQHVMNE